MTSMFAFSCITVWIAFMCDDVMALEATYQSSVDSVINCSPCSCHLKNESLIADCSNRSLFFVPNTLPKSISILNLTHNYVTTIESSHFENFPNLTVLDLSYNIIEDVDVAPFRNLTFLKTLTLAGNNLSYLYEDSFANLIHLFELNISDCSLSGMDPRSLIPLQDIRTLDLSRNRYLGFAGLENATVGLQNSSITWLLISRIVIEHELCVMITEQNLQYLQNTSLETLEADDNWIESFEPNALTVLPNTLKYVSVRNNRFAYAPYVEHVPLLKGLVDLDLGGHTKCLHDLIPFVPLNNALETHQTQSCYKKRFMRQEFTHEHFADIRFAFFTYLKTSNISRLPIPPNLKRVRYKLVESAFTIPEIYFGENKLEYIDMSYNVVAQWRGPIYGLNNLLHLDMSQNVASYVSDDFFINMTNLKFLNISGNSLERCLSRDSEGKIFRNFHNLEVLDLSWHYIPDLPYNVFQGLKSLTHLNLSHNNIYFFSFNFSYNKNLTFIDCSYNQITWFTPHQRMEFEVLIHTHSLSIDLSGNPLHCSCLDIEFWDWLLNSNITLLNVHQYVCHFSNATSVNMTNPKAIIDELIVSCTRHQNVMLQIIIVSSLSFLIGLLILGTVLYRYRWKLRYWFYAAKIRMKATSQPQPAFDFDAFVSYADENRFFVLNCMLPKLEAEGLLLNIHHRDFIPGNAIAENIIDAVQKSRKTILILSRDFLKSKWCRYELHMANMESITTGRDVILIVMLEDIPTGIIPPEILYQIQNNTYLEYPQSGGDLILFWNHLCQTLRR